MHPTWRRETPSEKAQPTPKTLKGLLPKQFMFLSFHPPVIRPMAKSSLFYSWAQLAS